MSLSTSLTYAPSELCQEKDNTVSFTLTVTNTNGQNVVLSTLTSNVGGDIGSLLGLPYLLGNGQTINLNFTIVYNGTPPIVSDTLKLTVPSQLDIEYILNFPVAPCPEELNVAGQFITLKISSKRVKDECCNDKQEYTYTITMPELSQVEFVELTQLVDDIFFPTSVPGFVTGTTLQPGEFVEYKFVKDLPFETCNLTRIVNATVFANGIVEQGSLPDVSTATHGTILIRNKCCKKECVDDDLAF